MTWGKILIVGSAAALSLALAAPSRAQTAQISGLQDVNFGTIPTMAQQSNSQNVVVCSYRNRPHVMNYSVIASGSGSGGAFQLSWGGVSLPYDVQWADSPGQTGGAMLQAGVPSSGFGNAANGFDCSQQPNTASLTVTIRAADLASAQAGSYSGSLQLTIVPE
jgi:hypothetical protein